MRDELPVWLPPAAKAKPSTPNLTVTDDAVKLYDHKGGALLTYKKPFGYRSNNDS